MIKIPHPLAQLTEADYLSVESAITATDVFSQMVTPCVYVIDMVKDNFLYVSECMLRHFRCKREEIVPLGRRMFEKYVDSEEDARLLRKFDHAIRAAYREGCHTDLSNEVLSIDLYMCLGGKKLMVHQKVRVLASDCDNRPWLLLGMMSRSAVRDGGHIIAGNAKSHTRRRFVDDEEAGHWEEMAYDRLSDVEMEMLSFTSRGYSIEEIARIMCCSIPTVKLYRKQVFDRLGADNAAQAIALADSLCLI